MVAESHEGPACKCLILRNVLIRHEGRIGLRFGFSCPIHGRFLDSDCFRFGRRDATDEFGPRADPSFLGVSLQRFDRLLEHDRMVDLRIVRGVEQGHATLLRLLCERVEFGRMRCM